MVIFEYDPPFELTSDMLNRVPAISEKPGEINAYHNLQKELSSSGDHFESDRNE